MTVSAVPSSAADNYVCWYEWRTVNGKPQQVMVCSIAGGDAEPVQPGEPIPVTVPDVGYDATGACWYRRTGAWTGWRLVQQFPDNSGLFWYSPSLNPTGPWVADALFPACTSRPSPTPPPIVKVWEVVEQYEFADPDPTLAPDGNGYTGLETFIGLDPPEPFTTTIPSPIGLGSIDVEIRVVTITVDWGDETEVSFAEAQFELFGGYPDGEVYHLYETKDFYDLTITYNWFVRWRANGGPWNTLTIDPTTWITSYQVDELVGRRTG